MEKYINPTMVVLALFFISVGCAFAIWPVELFDFLLASYNRTGISLPRSFEKLMTSSVNIIAFRVAGLVSIFAGGVILFSRFR